MSLTTVTWRADGAPLSITWCCCIKWKKLYKLWKEPYVICKEATHCNTRFNTHSHIHCNINQRDHGTVCIQRHESMCWNASSDAIELILQGGEDPFKVGCLKLQVFFHKRATNHRVRLRKMTSKDKASYDSKPLCEKTHPSLWDSFFWLIRSSQKARRRDINDTPDTKLNFNQNFVTGLEPESLSPSEIEPPKKKTPSGMDLPPVTIKVLQSNLSERETFPGTSRIRYGSPLHDFPYSPENLWTLTLTFPRNSKHSWTVAGNKEARRRMARGHSRNGIGDMFIHTQHDAYRHFSFFYFCFFLSWVANT